MRGRGFLPSAQGGLAVAFTLTLFCAKISTFTKLFGALTSAPTILLFYTFAAPHSSDFEI
jgi:hypothetical protein